MPSYLENLQTRREAVALELAEIDATKAGGKPNASGSNMVDHGEYYGRLITSLERLDRLIAEELGRTPYLREARGVT